MTTINLEHEVADTESGRPVVRWSKLILHLIPFFKVNKNIFIAPIYMIRRRLPGPLVIYASKPLRYLRMPFDFVFASNFRVHQAACHWATKSQVCVDASKLLLLTFV